MTDWPVIVCEIVMLPATITAALIGTWLHHRLTRKETASPPA